MNHPYTPTILTEIPDGIYAFMVTKPTEWYWSGVCILAQVDAVACAY
jgi:hypothetical protein